MNPVVTAMQTNMQQLEQVNRDLSATYSEWQVLHLEAQVAAKDFTVNRNATIHKLGAAGIAALGKTVGAQDAAIDSTLQAEFEQKEDTRISLELCEERIKSLQTSKAILTTLISGLKAILVSDSENVQA